MEYIVAASLQVFFFLYKWLMLMCKNTNTACSHSLVYITTEKARTKAFAVKLLNIPLSTTHRQDCFDWCQHQCQSCTSGPGGERKRKWFVPAAVQRLWLPVQLVYDWIIMVYLVDQAKNEKWELLLNQILWSFQFSITILDVTGLFHSRYLDLA